MHIDASQRPGFDPDYGHYTGHPFDPRTPEISAETAEMLVAVDEAEIALASARQLLESSDSEAGRLAAQTRIKIAIEWLTECLK